MAQLNKKTIIPLNARCIGSEYNEGVCYPLIAFEWEHQTYLFACVEQLGRYVSINGSGVIDGRFSIQSTKVDHLFKKTVTPLPVTAK